MYNTFCSRAHLEPTNAAEGHATRRGVRGQDPDTGSLHNCLYHVLPQFGLVASLSLLGTQVGLPPWLILNMEWERVILPGLGIKIATGGLSGCSLCNAGETSDGEPRYLKSLKRQYNSLENLMEKTLKSDT